MMVETQLGRFDFCFDVVPPVPPKKARKRKDLRGKPLHSFPVKDFDYANRGSSGRVLFAVQELFPTWRMFLQRTNSSGSKDEELLSRCIIPP
jgi:hypothetical protein